MHNTYEYVFDVSVDALAINYDPFNAAPWRGITRIHPDEVTAAIIRHEFSSWPHDDKMQSLPAEHAYHVTRIAYLVMFIDPEPIIVLPNDCGVFHLEDGWHRLAAAMYRGDATIKVAFGGTAHQLAALAWLNLSLAGSDPFGTGEPAIPIFIGEDERGSDQLG